tara:strand:- start:463 stop:792 length:330 start_codon:yes stop_codon:yes gene_type:complete
MKDTISVNKRRQLAYNQKENYDECWKISCKYSSILMKNINSCDLYNICCSIYGQYLTELKSKKLQLKDNKHNTKNYIQVWLTMLNTVKKGEVEKQGVRLLHQTNCQRSC